ncbi:MAG: TonB-dependent receptor, partial [Xanthomonadaceae bacterium]|nr:TonB-dependent receptor [Xanthomonadaceae bacterium]
MKDNRNPLAEAIHYALGAGVLVGLAASAAPAFAQEQEEDAADLDRVQITGSRLSRVDIEGARPVNILTREDIERIGLSDIGEVLRQLPAITGSPLSTATNNGGDGSSLTSLRGMGPARTLVLINGRRSNGASDFSTMPIVMIERIEVLKEGASAIYGADAVAGVVNIITRTDFSGGQVQVQFGQSLETVNNPAGALRDEWKGTDGDLGRFSAIIGDVGPKGSYVMGAERTKQDPVFQGNLKGAQFQQALGGNLSNFPGCLESGDCNTNGGSSSSLGGFFVPFDFNTDEDGNFIGRLGSFTRDLDTGEIRPFVGSDAYNFAPVNFIQQPFTRTSVFAEGNYDLFDLDNGFTMNGFLEGRWSNRRSEQELAPTPLFIGIFDPGAPLDNGPGEGVPASNAFNPFGEDIVDLRRRVAEGRRRFEQDVVRTNITGGVRGDIGQALPTWTYEASFHWGRTNQTNTDFGQFVGANFRQAVGPSFFDDAGNAVCGTPENPIAGCVPMNLFGGFGSITQEMLDFAGAELVDRLDSTLTTISGGVSGDLFQLPAGPVGLALGYEFRDQKLNSIPDSGKATDSVTGNTFSKTEGDFEVNSWFAETNIPLLADLPFAHLLEVGAGVRYDNFSTIGDNTVFMVNGRWQPYRDLLIRGSFSEVFREPTIFNLFSPQGDSFPSFQDPCSNGIISDPDSNLFAGLTPEQQAQCRATGVPDGGFFQTNAQPRARVGGNPNLEPEEGETITFGFTFAPSQLPGLSLTVDYWDIDLDDPITVVDAEDVVNQCIFAGNQDFCNDITRDLTINPGEVISIVSQNRNAGSLTATGVDFDVSYTWSTDLGLFRARSLWTWLDEREGEILAGSGVDVAGEFSPGINGIAEGVFPEWSGYSTLDWSYADLGASIGWEWLSEVDNLGNPALGPVRRTQYWDLTGRYDTPWGTEVAAG